MRFQDSTNDDGGVALDAILGSQRLVDGGIDSTELGGSLKFSGGLGPLGSKVLAVTACNANPEHAGGVLQKSVHLHQGAKNSTIQKSEDLRTSLSKLSSVSSITSLESEEPEPLSFLEPEPEPDEPEEPALPERRWLATA